jgi:hypothetical protein
MDSLFSNALVSGTLVIQVPYGLNKFNGRICQGLDYGYDTLLSFHLERHIKKQRDKGDVIRPP